MPLSESKAAKLAGSPVGAEASAEASTGAASAARSSKRTPRTPPGARAVAVACRVAPAKEPLAGLVNATVAWLTSLQVTLLVSHCWLEGQAGLHTDDTQAPLTQASPAPQEGKHAPCGTTQTAGLR